MAVNVNLIKNRHSISEAEYQKERLLFRSATILAVVVVVITLAVSIWQFILTVTLNRIETEVEASSRELQSLSEASAMQIYLKSRLNLITSFLDDRSISREAMQKVFAVDIPGVTISGLSFEDDNLISLRATATSVLAFSQLVDFVSQRNDFFLQVVSQGVSRSEDGNYEMTLLLTLPKG